MPPPTHIKKAFPTGADVLAPCGDWYGNRWLSARPFSTSPGARRRESEDNECSTIGAAQPPNRREGIAEGPLDAVNLSGRLAMLFSALISLRSA